jgi:hypothetical protein
MAPSVPSTFTASTFKENMQLEETHNRAESLLENFKVSFK